MRAAGRGRVEAAGCDNSGRQLEAAAEDHDWTGAAPLEVSAHVDAVAHGDRLGQAAPAQDNTMPVDAGNVGTLSQQDEVGPANS